MYRITIIGTGTWFMRGFNTDTLENVREQVKAFMVANDDYRPFTFSSEVL